MLNATELADIQAAALGAMGDACQVQTYALAKDEWGAETPTYTPGTSYACGLTLDLGGETYTVEGTVYVVEAQLRLPLSAWGDVTSRDRVKLTHRFGVQLDAPITYAILGHPQRGASAVLLKVRQVE